MLGLSAGWVGRYAWQLGKQVCRQAGMRYVCMYVGVSWVGVSVGRACR